MLRSTTPLRYPGGKQKMAPYIKQIIRLNKLDDGLYAEPYAGGAGLAFDLLFSEKIYHLRLNDADTNIYSFWKSVLDETDNLCTMIMETPVSMVEWERQRAILNDKSGKCDLAHGFATFFMNRCNRSGILKGGPIGGVLQTGKWRIDARYNKDELVKRIRRISCYRTRIKIFNLDALDFLALIESDLSVHPSLVYLDPPYYKKGQDLYLNAYCAEDHKKVADFMQKNYHDYNWIISYDNCPQISELYSNLRCTRQVLNYSVSSKPRMGEELVFYSPSLLIPHTQ